MHRDWSSFSISHSCLDHGWYRNLRTRTVRFANYSRHLMIVLSFQLPSFQIKILMMLFCLSFQPRGSGKHVICLESGRKDFCPKKAQFVQKTPQCWHVRLSFLAGYCWKLHSQICRLFLQTATTINISPIHITFKTL